MTAVPTSPTSWTTYNTLKLAIHDLDTDRHPPGAEMTIRYFDATQTRLDHLRRVWSFNPSDKRLQHLRDVMVLHRRRASSRSP
ncbi:hypothetical protein E4U56_005283 [Claviceps arundinis]|uniref:Uncharacterized protein n=1 Tax=Claviceps arundinis TaxID=1623583 RepID=A0A9P7ST80_9HYPO|nr:hypothetical protein E4U56_005283 [Claviceps arundinis]